MTTERRWACEDYKFEYCCKLWLYFERSIFYNCMHISVKVVLNIVNTKYETLVL
jgi:hypothetical protein